MSRPYFEQAQRVGQQTGLDPNLVWAQWYHESAGFNSQLARENFNFGGVTQEEPNGEENKQPDGGNYYKVFRSPDEYADWYANYIQLYRPDGLFEAQNVQEFASALKRGGYYTADETEYTNGMRNALGVDPIDLFFNTGMGAYGLPEGTPNPQDPQAPPTLWQESKDKFLDQFYDKGVISVLRSGWTALESMSATGHWQIPGFSNYTPSQTEVDMVSKMLPNDYTAQKFILMNAMSSDHLQRLLQTKQEDAERAQRVSGYGWGASTVASFAGAVLDPLMLIPVIGQEAVVARGLARLGQTGLKLSQSKLMQYGELATANMAMFGADRYLAARYGGREPNYGAALGLGAFAGVAGGYLKDLARRGIRNDGLTAIDNMVDNMESHSLALVTDAPLPSEFASNARAFLRKYHDTDYATTITKEGSDAFQLIKEGRLVIMTKEAAKEAAEKLGISLQDDFKAFDIPGANISVLAKEHVTPENIDGLLAHEVAVHGGLDEFLGKPEYSQLMQEVRKQVDNPQTPEWRKAVKTGGDLEEILGHWIEQKPKNDNVFSILKGKADAQMRKLGLKSNVSDEEFRDIVQRSLQNQIYRDNPVHINTDGTMDVHGIRYSQNNIFNVNTWDKWFDETRALSDSAQKGWFPKALGRSLEAGWFAKNPYGVLKNSKTRTAALLADLLGHDPRMRTRSSAAVMPAEKQAEHLLNRWKAMVAPYWDLRNKYMVDTIMTHGGPSPYRMRQFDLEVMECFNAKYAGNTSGLTRTSWDSAIEEGANKIKAILEDMWQHAQLPAERLGGVKGKPSLIDKRLQPVDLEFFRVTAEEKMTKLLGTYFKTTGDAIKFFTTYARQYVKRDIVEAKLQRAEDIRYDDTLAAWQRGGSQGNAPVKQAITTKMVDEWIEEESIDWAKGQVDRNLSRMTFKGAGRYGNDTATFLRERFPMDTSGEMLLPNGNGKTFSFDRDLRETSIDQILPKMMKRLSGEIAINNTLGDLPTRTKILDRFAQELEQAEKRPGGISTAQKELELKAAHTMIDRIRGTQEFGENRTVMDAFSELLRNKTYSDVGGNMWLAQLGELGGAMGYVGTRILMSVIPSISEVYRSATLGKVNKELVEEVTKRTFGENLRNRVWSDSASYESRVFREVSEYGSKLAAVGDKANEVAKFTGKMTSAVNRLPGLTNRMIDEARTWTTLDSIQWANGEKFRLRNPFSDWNLKAVGIKDTAAAQSLKADIKKYIGSVKAEDELWQEQNPTTYFQWKMLVDNNALKAFQQETVGNTPMLKEANWFTRAFFQFKDFTFRAINGQTMRALSSHQLSDGLAALFSMGTNMLAYMGLTEGRAWARYPHDEAKRDAYRKEQWTPWRLGVAAFSRGAITGSIPGFATDAYEIMTGTPMFRTTVDNTKAPGQKAPIQNSQNNREFMGNLGENLMKQIPAANSINKIRQAPVGAYHMLTGRGSQQDIQDIINGLSLNGWLGMIYLATEIKDNSGLPKKPQK